MIFMLFVHRFQEMSAPNSIVGTTRPEETCPPQHIAIDVLHQSLRQQTGKQVWNLGILTHPL